MAIDFNKPATTDNYSTAFVPNINNAIKALGALLDPTYAGTVSNQPTGTKRLNNGLFEQWNGTSWAALSMGYALKGGDTFSGVVVFSNTLTANGAATFAGAAAFNGGVTLGDANTDALTINSATASIPNGLNFTGGAPSVSGNPLYHAGNFVPMLRSYPGSGVDLNTLTNGAYRLGTGAANQPSGTDYGQLLAVYGGGDTIAQIVCGYTSNVVYFRSGNPSNVGGAGSWNTWKKMLLQGDDILVASASIGAASYGLATITGSYGSVNLVGTTGGYHGFYLPNGGSTTVGMFNSTGNGGEYDPTTGWHHYWDRTNACLAIGGTTTAAGYKAYVNGKAYVAGDLVASGNITAYSDERIKEAFAPSYLSLDQMLTVEHLSYRRKDTGRDEIGVRAQQLARVLPLAVHYDAAQDRYSVDYGRAALAFAASLAREVRDLRSMVRARHIREVNGGAL